MLTQHAILAQGTQASCDTSTLMMMLSSRSGKVEAQAKLLATNKVTNVKAEQKNL